MMKCSLDVENVSLGTCCRLISCGIKVSELTKQQQQQVSVKYLLDRYAVFEKLLGTLRKTRRQRQRQRQRKRHQTKGSLSRTMIGRVRFKSLCIL